MNIINRKLESPYQNVLYVLAGAGIGLAAGLLLAPKSGLRLRAEIGAAVDDYLDTAREKAEEFRSAATQFADRELKEVRKARDNAKDNVTDAVNSAADAVNNTAAKAADHVVKATDAGAQEAHGAINRTVAAVQQGAKKGHEAVDQAAATIRSGARDAA